MTTRGLIAATALMLAPSAALAQASPSAFTSATRYDASGQVTGTISPDPDGPAGPLPFRAARTTYDAAGRPIRQETGTLAAWKSETVAPGDWGTDFVPLRTAEIQYDAMGRKVREWVREGVAGPVRSLTEYSYDQAGLVECTAVRMNPAVFAFSGTPNSCVANAQGTAPNDYGPDRITRNRYDEAGQRVQFRVGVGSAAGGNDVEGAEATWAYNANGQITAVIDGNGNRAELRYDGHGRQERWTFPSATPPASYNDTDQTTALATAGAVNPADYEGYGYDANGNRTSRRLRNGQNIHYTFDALNRMTEKDITEGAYAEFDITYAYDLQGRMLSAISDHGHVAGYTYDGFGRTLSEIGPMGTKQMAWDRNGRMTRLTWPDGFYVTQDHLDTGEVTHIRENGATSGEGVLATLEYDQHGRRDVLTRGNGARTDYDYDALGRLIRLEHDLANTANDVEWTYTHNPASQVRSAARDNNDYSWTGHYAVNRNYATNGLNQYSAAGPATFAYDANGNLTNDSSRAYVYTSDNRLAGSGTSQIWYEPMGRLHQLYHYDSTTEHMTRFDNLGDRIVSETYLNSGALRRYVHGPGADEILVQYEDSGTGDRRHLHADPLGSIVAASGTNAVRLTVNRYDEYGIPAPTNVGRFQYTGQAFLAELGLYYYKSRAYSPTLGRFMQTDSVGYEGGINLYAYVENDPVNAVDSEGTLPDVLVDAGLIIADGVDIWRNGLNWENAASLAGNIGGLFIPGVTGVGPAARGLVRGGDAAADAARSQRASTLRPGPNARESIPTTSRRATAAERREVDRIGNRYGCHTCSSRESGNRGGRWTPDHQRPSALNPNGRAQRLYPQCRNCSNRQGGEVTQANRRNQPRPSRPRDEGQ